MLMLQAAAVKIESDIYEELYGNQLSLVGWYHSNPHGPAAPSAKDCFDQLDFQIRLLGNNDSTYTPCVGLVCAPYQPDAKTEQSSIIVYWMFPPGENTHQDCGKPMRMSYSAITDPCLSEEIIQQVDRVICWSRTQPSPVPLTECWRGDTSLLDKLGRSLVSKFPQDQDEQLWLYIRSQLLDGLPELPEKVTACIPHSLSPKTTNAPNTTVDTDSAAVNGRKNSEEEEIDDDEETALNEQEEIDDDEESAMERVETRDAAQNLTHGAPTQSAGDPALVTIAQFSPAGTQMTFTRAQDGGAGEVSLSIRETVGEGGGGLLSQLELEPLALTKPGPGEEGDSGDEDRLVIRE